jgi:hypothetical protein
MSNKYNSIRETFTSNPLLSATLSTLATPPADLDLTNANFTAKQLYAEVATAGNFFTKFAINDHPRIVGVGLFCNMADGLVHITAAEDFASGLILSLALADYNVAGVLQHALGQYEFKLAELNQIFETDVLFDVAAVDVLEDSLRLTASVSASSTSFSMITVDPLFAVKLITFRPVIVVEHSLPVTEA